MGYWIMRDYMGGYWSMGDYVRYYVNSPMNPDLGVLTEIAEGFLAKFGWYLVFLTVCVIVLIQYLSKKRASQVNTHSSNEPAQAIQVPYEEPALIMRRQEALEASRNRLQEDLDAKAPEYNERQEMLEEEKMKQRRERGRQRCFSNLSVCQTARSTNGN